MHSLSGKSWINAVPLMARKTVGFAIKTKRRSIAGNKIEELLSQPRITFNSAYIHSRSLFTLKELSQLLSDAQPFGQIQKIVEAVPQTEAHLLSAVSIAEINTYLQNTLLRDTDQMSMAVALEVREPFLDHKLIEFALSVGDNFKFPHTPKKLLVDSLGDLLPPEIVNRPKMGFTLPWQQWMKNDLKSFCEKNLSEFAEYPFCQKENVLSLWTRFLAGDKTVTWSRIWHLVVLNNWIKENKVAFE
jgi:asparagine synthase (glutamine-hydrolysing)